MFILCTNTFERIDTVNIAHVNVGSIAIWDIQLRLNHVCDSICMSESVRRHCQAIILG